MFWEPVPLMEPKYWVQTLLIFWKKVGVGSFLLIYGTVQILGSWREHLSISYLFGCGYFLICFMCRSYSTSFWISLSSHCSTYSCTFGGPWKGAVLETCTMPAWSASHPLFQSFPFPLLWLCFSLFFFLIKSQVC